MRAPMETLAIETWPKFFRVIFLSGVLFVTFSGVSLVTSYFGNQKVTWKKLAFEDVCPRKGGWISIAMLLYWRVYNKCFWTLRIIGPSKLAILRTLPLLHRFRAPSIGGSKILRESHFNFMFWFLLWSPSSPTIHFFGDLKDFFWFLAIAICNQKPTPRITGPCDFRGVWRCFLHQFWDPMILRATCFKKHRIEHCNTEVSQS